MRSLGGLPLKTGKAEGVKAGQGAGVSEGLAAHRTLYQLFDYLGKKKEKKERKK